MVKASIARKSQDQVYRIILCQVKEVACYYKFTEEKKLCSHAGFEDEESGSEPRNIGYFWMLEKTETDSTRGFFQLC